ncbi:hypothetical protein V7148_16645, partial [Gottfriedia acidiceleris]|uniref:hypothetical protein n=1 Tax=Gottfriedia acidiceleris TaxID=371036 RepID=UPI002FFED9C9
MTDLWYSEKDSLAFSKDYMNYGESYERVVGNKNVIVLLSNFKVDSSGGDGSWKPNSTQTRYTWILIRNNDKGKWRVIQTEDTYTDANHVKVRIGQSKKLTKTDIKTAFDTVKKEFKKDKNNEGCTITELHYSENQAIDADTIDDYMEDKNAIVVFSTIKTAPTVVGGWDANQTMDNFSWTLVRDSKKGKWRVKDAGYAFNINLFFLTNAMFSFNNKRLLIRSCIIGSKKQKKIDAINKLDLFIIVVIDFCKVSPINAVHYLYNISCLYAAFCATG